MNHSSTIFAYALCALLAACGTSDQANSVVSQDTGGGADSSAADAGGSDTSISRTDGGTDDAASSDDVSRQADASVLDTGTSANARLEETCESACETRQLDEMGGCELGWMHGDPEAPCEDICVEVGTGWSDLVVDALEFCVSNDPLCFQSIEQCVLTYAYPDGTEYDINVRGAGFDSAEGLTVTVGTVDGDGDATSGAWGQVRDGSFEVELPEQFGQVAWGGPLLVIFIDIDGNGRCDVGVDFADTRSSLPITEFEDIVVEYEFEPGESSEWHCQVANSL